ncbi:MAG: hypothetical protein HYW89_04215 [Candidatus Sungiibacteriota bacterium]|uniref:Uncharacterized protein n=1 Tax=Candidatus Sungiibacteriota bacterium TaxID=2750080 RepID=A0A7T5RJC2_9BACT|nr:MAG: hypothetical protein HYW89_04215 [Candidatus Sungbacteria bacterium]
MTIHTEERIQNLKAAIITKLKEIGGDPAIQLQRVGYEAIRICSNEDIGGWDALMLHVDGSWSVKFAMSGYSLDDNPPLTELFEILASIADPSFCMLDETQQTAYLLEHRESLTHGLIAALEKTLQKLS